MAIRRVQDAVSKEYGGAYRVYEVSRVDGPRFGDLVALPNASLPELAEPFDADEF